MKKILALLVLLITVVTAKSDSYVESYNVISDRYINLIQETPIIRQINGGTAIIPVFDESCPEEMKSPFSYACKIVEEYMPPCLPLKVKVSCDILNGLQVRQSLRCWREARRISARVYITTTLR